VGLVWAAWALITPGHGQGSTTGSLSGPAGLGRPKGKRELVTLVAQGRTNAQIAA
jgi:hypothetical protein